MNFLSHDIRIERAPYIGTVRHQLWLDGSIAIVFGEPAALPYQDSELREAGA